MLSCLVFEFIIPGNQDNHTGNPIPYLRMTRGSKWSPMALRYGAWKAYIVDHFVKHCLDENKQGSKVVASRVWRKKKPISPSYQKAFVSLMVHFTGKAHGDPDNILKAVNDALFEDDNRVACLVDFKEGQPVGKIEVKIKINL